MRYIYQENREGYACSQAGHQKHPEDERRIALCQLRGHENVGVGHTEISQDALIELEA